MTFKCLLKHIMRKTANKNKLCHVIYIWCLEPVAWFGFLDEMVTICAFQKEILLTELLLFSR